MADEITFQNNILTKTTIVEEQTDVNELCHKKQLYLTSIKSEKGRLAEVQAQIDVAVLHGFVEPEYIDVE